MLSLRWNFSGSVFKEFICASKICSSVIYFDPPAASFPFLMVDGCYIHKVNKALNLRIGSCGWLMTPRTLSVPLAIFVPSMASLLRPPAVLPAVSSCFRSCCRAGVFQQSLPFSWPWPTERPSSACNTTHFRVYSLLSADWCCAISSSYHTGGHRMQVSCCRDRRCAR